MVQLGWQKCTIQRRRAGGRGVVTNFCICIVRLYCIFMWQFFIKKEFLTNFYPVPPPGGVLSPCPPSTQSICMQHILVVILILGTHNAIKLKPLDNHLDVVDVDSDLLTFFPQELRVLKNFSSLKAIISGLQSNPIYRLKKAWSYVPRDKLEVFEELARIFSGENNALAQRELLVREG